MATLPIAEEILVFTKHPYVYSVIEIAIFFVVKCTFRQTWVKSIKTMVTSMWSFTSIK